MEVITSNKSIYRAIGRTFAKNKAKIIAMMAGYGVNLPANPTNKEVLDPMLELMDTNENFRTEIAALIYKTGEYSNCCVGFDGLEYKNGAGEAAKTGVVADPISAISGAISSLFGFGTTIINKATQKKENRQQILLAIMQAEANKQKAKTNPTPYIVLGIVLLGCFTIAGIVIYKKMSKTK